MKVDTIRNQVIAFHIANDQPILEEPTVPSNDRVCLRLALITEEFFELLEAAYGATEESSALKAQFLEAINDTTAEALDLPAFVDALADLDYVIEGTRLEFGIDGGPIAAEVHRSNMSKLGADGKPVRREDGKIMKGPNFTPPDIAGELRKQGWEG